MIHSGQGGLAWSQQTCRSSSLHDPTVMPATNQLKLQYMLFGEFKAVWRPVSISQLFKSVSGHVAHTQKIQKQLSEQRQAGEAASGTTHRVSRKERSPIPKLCKDAAD